MKKIKKNSITKKMLVAGIGAVVMVQAIASPLIVSAKETTAPNWTFTQNAGNLPDDAGTPQDDLNLYVNYDYLKEHQDTDSQSSTAVDGMNEASDQVKDLLEKGNLKGSAEEQLQTFYEQAKDFKTRDQQGMSEIQSYIDQIMNAGSIKELNKVLTSDGFPFEAFIRTIIGTNDLRKDAAVSILPKFLTADSTEGSQYMADDVDSMNAVMNALEESAARYQALLALYHLDQQEFSYNDLADFEKQYGKLAFNSSYLDMADGVAPEEWKDLYESCSFDQLKELCSNFPLADMLENAGRSGAGTYTVQCSQWLKKLDSLWTDKNLEMIKTIAAVQVLTECAPYLDSSFQLLQEGVTLDGESPVAGEVVAADLCYYLHNFTLEDLTNAIGTLAAGGLDQYIGSDADLLIEKAKELGAMLDSLGSKEGLTELLQDKTIASFAAELCEEAPNIVQMVAQTMAQETLSSEEEMKSFSLSDDGLAFKCCDNVYTFGQLLGQIYVDDCLGSDAKERVEGLTDDLITAYKELVNKTTWIEEGSKENILEKLDNMRLDVLEPDGGYISFDDLKLTSTEDGGTLLGNYLKVKKYVKEQENSRIGQASLARMCWDYFTPLTYNCFYDADSNSINIYPGFLSSFNYGDDFTEEELLAKMGFVIGHEISHAFDYAGCHYDAYGVLNDCLTEEDQLEYDQILEQLAGYYSSIELEDGVYEDGEKIIGEAGADLCAVGAVEECAKEIGDLDFQEIYSYMAEVWASVCVRGTYKAILALDTHPLDCLRTNVNVQMYDTFYESFNVEEGDGMYLPEDQRIRIWGV